MKNSNIRCKTLSYAFFMGTQRPLYVLSLSFQYWNNKLFFLEWFKVNLVSMLWIHLIRLLDGVALVVLSIKRYISPQKNVGHFPANARRQYVFVSSNMYFLLFTWFCLGLSRIFHFSKTATSNPWSRPTLQLCVIPCD